MTKRALTMLIIAVLLVGGATAVIASSIGAGDQAASTHVMPGGQTMQDDNMKRSHTMSNGETMSGTDMGK